MARELVNIAAIAATVSLTGSLLLGADRFGWTTWALVNRYCGWFFLLSYGATGALLVLEGGSRALRIFALTFVGATVAVAGIDLTLVLLSKRPSRHRTRSSSLAISKVLRRTVIFLRSNS